MLFDLAPYPMEDFADELWTHVEELKFERALADGSIARALRENGTAA